MSDLFEFDKGEWLVKEARERLAACPPGSDPFDAMFHDRPTPGEIWDAEKTKKEGKRDAAHPN